MAAASGTGGGFGTPPRGAPADAAAESAGGGSGARRAALLGAGLADYGQDAEARLLPNSNPKP